MPKIRNIIIFVTIGAALVLVYIFFVKPSLNNNDTLVSVVPTNTNTTSDNTVGDVSKIVNQDYLSLLLSVKNIKLDDSIFSDKAFISLDGSNSVVLVPDGTEGRPNPFAPIGSDAALPANNTTPN